MMKVLVKGTFNLPSCGFQQTNWETGAPEVPAGWKAEEGKTLVTQLLRVVGLNPTAPTKEEGLCLLSISETGNWERVSGSGPRKEARPSSLFHMPQNYSDQFPQALLPESGTPGGMRQQEGMWSGGCRFSQSKGNSMFSGTLGSFWDYPCSHQCPHSCLWKVI